MKTIKKLTLRKETITSLDGHQMGQLKGGTANANEIMGTCPCTNYPPYPSDNCSAACGGYTQGCVSGPCGGSVVPSPTIQNCATVGNQATCAGYVWGYLC